MLLGCSAGQLVMSAWFAASVVPVMFILFSECDAVKRFKGVI
jgi:hypothetical protein